MNITTTPEQHFVSYSGTTDVNTSVITMVTTTAPSSEQFFDLAFWIFIVYCFLSPLILLGNGLTIVTVTRYVTKVTPALVAVGYLAVADFMIGLTPWFQLATYLTQGYKYWRNLCTFGAWFENISVSLNLNAVMLIAIERYFMITKWDMYQRKYTVGKHGIATSITTVVFLVLGAFSHIVGQVIPTYGRCYFAFMRRKGITLMLRATVYTTITTMLIVSYVRIVYFLWKERRSVGVITGQNQNQFNLMKRTTMLVTLVVTIYLITTVPAAIYLSVLSTVSGDDVTRSHVHVLGILSFIYYCNSIINPIIYASRIPVFKEAYCKIFRRVFRTGKNQIDVLHVHEVNLPELGGSNFPMETRRDSEI